MTDKMMAGLSALGGTDAMEAAQRGFAALGAAQELAMKAWMRAATRQAELAREAMMGCMAPPAGLGFLANGGAPDGQDAMRSAGEKAETWFRTWRSIGDDLRHDLMEAADIMVAGMPLGGAAAAPAANGAARKSTAAR